MLRMPRVLRRAVVLLFLGGLVPLAARQPYLSLELELNYSALDFASSLDFRPMNRMSDEGRSLSSGDYEAVRREAVRLLLEEARWIFSGMIYGFDFRYVPGNLNSGPEPEFSLDLRHWIRRGDEGLVPYQVEDGPDDIRVLFYYWPDDYEQERLSVSRQGLFRASAGEGVVFMMEEGARLSCLKEGVKAALRRDLRKLYYNRPLEVQGFVFFSSAPWISIRGGEYRGLVRILYQEKSLRDFPGGE